MTEAPTVDVGTREAPGRSFQVENPYLAEWLDKQSLELAGNVSDTTLKNLQDTLTDGIRAGEGVPQLKARVQSTFKEASDYRAQMIARTEANKGANGASWLQATSSGVVKTKTWLATGDERTRPEHRAMNGETAPIDEPFSNGQMFPSAPNCRCTLTYGVDESKLKDSADGISGLESKYPGTVFDLGDMDPVLRTKVLAQLDTLADEWPAVARRIKRVHIEPGEQPYIAAMNLGEYMGDNKAAMELKFAGNLWGDEALLQAKLQELTKSKFLHAGATSPEAIVTHEFGHALDSYLTGLEGKQLTPYRNLDKGIGSVARIHKGWKKSHKPTKKLSGYSTTNPDEGFAEGFSAIHHHPNPDKIPYVKQQRDELEAMKPVNHMPENHEQYYDAPHEKRQAERDRTERLSERLGLTK